MSNSNNKEAVHHPQHYGGGDNPYEVIKVIDAWELDFNLGNSVKYIARAGKKDKDKEAEDLKKAAWYLNHRLELLGALPKEAKPNPKRHKWEHVFIDGCEAKCGSCNLCCLSVCDACGQYEGGLTTHCPGAKGMTPEQSEAIYAGKLNYRGGIWVTECSEHAPAYHAYRQKEFCGCPIPTVGPVKDGTLTCGICHRQQKGM